MGSGCCRKIFFNEWFIFSIFFIIFQNNKNDHTFLMLVLIFWQTWSETTKNYGRGRPSLSPTESKLKMGPLIQYPPWNQQ